MSLKVYFLTLGCKVNSYETAAIGKLLSEEGFEETEDPSSCDVYIVNTGKKELLISVIKDCILNVDIERGEIQVHLLPGLI